MRSMRRPVIAGVLAASAFAVHPDVELGIAAAASTSCSTNAA